MRREYYYCEDESYKISRDQAKNHRTVVLLVVVVRAVVGSKK